MGPIAYSKPKEREEGEHAVSILVLLALHAFMALVFLVLAALQWAHADRKWTFSAEHIPRNDDIATYLLGIFVATCAAVFFATSHSLFTPPARAKSSRHHSPLVALYFVLIILLLASAPQILSFRSETRTRDDALVDRQVVRHDSFHLGDFDGTPANFFQTSQIPQLAYYGPGATTLSATPGLVGNIVHDAGALKSGPQPLGSFNASATQFSVSCSALGGIKASAVDTQFDADPSDGPYSSIQVTVDVPGRGSVNLQDIAYNGGDRDGQFGLPFGKGIDHVPSFFPPSNSFGKVFIRFPKVFNASASAVPQFSDTTLSGVRYDRTADGSGVDDDLSNTIFFYMFRLVAGGFSRDPERDAPLIKDQDGRAGSQANITIAQDSVFSDYALVAVQSVACTMSATSFNTTVSHADNTPDLSKAPVSLAARLAHNSSWSAFQPSPASSNIFEKSWANIFTPLSAPTARLRSDNSSAVPGFFPLSTLESYMTDVVSISPQLATLESALENITALAYWGAMQEWGDIVYGGGLAPGQVVGVAQFKRPQLYLSFGSSVLLLLLAVLAWHQQRRV